MNVRSHKHLVIATVGDDSIHHRWLSEPNRKFDVLLVYSGHVPGRYERDGDFYIHAAGPKWALIDRAAKQLGSFIEEYDSVFCPDDDLVLCSEEVNRLFELFHVLEVDLGQPALAPGSHTALRHMKWVPFAIARFVERIETRAPLFSRRAWQLLSSTFAESETGGGLDLLWAKLLDYRAIAVIHDVSVVHTRPEFSGSLHRGQVLHDTRTVISKYGLRDEWERNDRVVRTILRPGPKDHIQQLFELQLPIALHASSHHASKSSATYRFTVEGAGSWFVDSSAAACDARDAAADCMLSFRSEDAFFSYLENPEARMFELFLDGSLEVSGRDVEAHNAYKVFRSLWSYSGPSP